MKRGLVLGFFASGVVLATAVTMMTGETSPAGPDPSSGGAVGVTSARQDSASSTEDRQRWAADSLARPLFAPDRRPVALPSQRGPGETNELPRLSGIMITQSSRSAIFVPSRGGKPEVVTEGGRIGAYSVQSISDEQVVLTGPHGRQSLHPTFDQMGSASNAQPAAVQTLVKESSP